MMRENHIRSVTKCFTWRATAFLDTVLLSLLFTGSIGRAFAIGGIEIFTKTGLYYIHERIWLRLVRRIDRNRTSGDSFAHTHRYSVYKTFSWRFVGSLDTFAIVLFVTGELATSTAIGVAEIITKSILYYLHERAWLRINWGRKEVTEEESRMMHERAQKEVLV